MKKTLLKKSVPNPKKAPVKASDELVESSALPAELKPGTRRVGVSKGLTINMGDYNSARIAFWMERVVEDTDKAAQAAIVEMSQMVEEALQEEAEELRGG